VSPLDFDFARVFFVKYEFDQKRKIKKNIDLKVRGARYDDNATNRLNVNGAH